MSLINDALKQARQHPPADAPPLAHPPLPPLQPVAHNPIPVAGWLIPAIVIFLIVAAIFFAGWAMANRSVNSKIVVTPVASAPAAMPVTPAPVVVTPPVVTPAPAPEPSPAAVVEAPPLPVLQGIFYSPTAPTAIVDGKTVRLGDVFKQYRVKEITKSTVILVDAAGKATKLVMGN